MHGQGPPQVSIYSSNKHSHAAFPFTIVAQTRTLPEHATQPRHIVTDAGQKRIKRQYSLS